MVLVASRIRLAVRGGVGRGGGGGTGGGVGGKKIDRRRKPAFATDRVGEASAANEIATMTTMMEEEEGGGGM